MVRDWLEQNAPGFCDLTPEDRNAILNFTILWSLFEAKALGKRGNARTINRAVRAWHAAGLIEAPLFPDALAYFRARFFENGAPSAHFGHLRLKPPDKTRLVSDVLSGQNQTPLAEAIATLIVIYRFRNNLFHGEKWAYNLQGQSDNFAMSNSVLIEALKVQAALEATQNT